MQGRSNSSIKPNKTPLDVDEGKDRGKEVELATGSADGRARLGLAAVPRVTTVDVQHVEVDEAVVGGVDATAIRCAAGT